MPRGPKARSALIGNAVHVKRIATGEIEDIIPDDGKDPAAKALGKKGGAARAKDMTPGAESWVMIPVPVLLSVAGRPLRAALTR